MTREAKLLIDMWDILHRECHKVVTEENYDAIKKSIKALEQEPCEDCISRQAVIDCFKKWQPWMATRLHEFEEELFDLPSVKPKEKVGHWITEYDRWGDIVTTISHYQCSECKQYDYDKDNYCPNCGARMEGGAENDD